MEASCTFVADSAWIAQAIFLSSLTVAILGCAVLAHLRDRQLEAEGGEDGESPDTGTGLVAAAG